MWPSYLHGFLANIVVFAYIPLFCKKCPPTQTALSAENLNILVTELRIRGYPKDFQNLGVGFRGVGRRSVHDTVIASISHESPPQNGNHKICMSQALFFTKNYG